MKSSKRMKSAIPEVGEAPKEALLSKKDEEKITTTEPEQV